MSLPHLDRIGPHRLLFVMATEHEYGPRLRARIRPLITGVGPIEAAGGTAAALAGLREPPDAVVSLGSAGSRRLPLGGVYQVSAVSWRDIDATPLGFARGVTPFADFPAVAELPTPLDLPGATLSTGADVLVGAAYDAIGADMVDMETYAVWRACARFGVPLIGLRGVSDGAADGERLDWTRLLGLLDERLVAAVDQFAALTPRSLLEVRLAPGGLHNEEQDQTAKADTEQQREHRRLIVAAQHEGSAETGMHRPARHRRPSGPNREQVSSPKAE